MATHRVSVGICPPEQKGPLMSEPDRSTGNDTGQKWRHVGPFVELSKYRCHRLFSKRGKDHDLALFYNEGQFYCMEAWCSHMGGPLFQGEIEDYKKECHVMCPWHGYMFKLETGENEIGLKQETYPVKVENREVFIKYYTDVSLFKYI